MIAPPPSVRVIGEAAALACLLLSSACGSSPAPAKTPPGYDSLRHALEPLHSRMPPVAAGDWLAAHSEPGQTFEQYLASAPPTANPARRVLYVVQIGDLSKEQDEAFAAVADFLGRFYALPVRRLAPLPESVVPESARHESQWGVKQFRTGPILRDVLSPRVPPDAAGLLGFTATDLWPGEGWNFVFGQATWSQRAGLFSFCRLFAGKWGAERGLRRALAMSTHEVGHLFGMRHCTEWLCLMNGCNSLEELDRHPLWLCPDCLMKLSVASGADKEKHCRGLAGFCKERGLSKETEFYEREAAVIAGYEQSR